jgi:hypothetical protein
MKTHLFSIIAFLCLATFTPAPTFAIESPRIVPRITQVPQPADEIFTRLKKYFSDPTVSHFQLVSADPRTRTIVAKQSGIDGASWNNWAFCKAGPVQMIYKYQDGTATVTVKLEKTNRHLTLVSASADFEGLYALGANQNQVACNSKFALEENILAVAGAAKAK